MGPKFRVYSRLGLYTMKKETLNKINSKFNNSSKKRVLIVISCFFPFIGGDENTAKFLAEKLVKLGWKVTVLTKLRDRSLSKDEIINSVPVIRVGGDILGIFIKAIQLINSFDTLFFVGALGGNLKIKVLIQAFLGFIAKKLFKKRVVMKLGSSKEEYEDLLFKPKITKKLLKSFDAFMPVNEGLVNFLVEKVGIDKNKVKNPPFKFIDTKKFKPLGINEVNEIKTLLEIPKDKKLILFVGRASQEKNIQTLINVFKNLDDSFFLVLVLAVQLKKKNKFWEELKSTFPKTNFKFVINELNPQKLMAISDVLIMPSIREGKGGVQFEAMACGTPSICSNLVNITESLPNELLDLTFDPMNEDDLKSKILLFFNLSQKTMVKDKLIEFVNKSFSEEVILKKYIFILLEKQANTKAKKKKIIFQVPWYLPRIGGIQSAVSRISQGLIQKGCEVTVVTKKDNSKLNSIENMSGVDVIRFEMNLLGNIAGIFTTLILVLKGGIFIFMGNLNHIGLFQKITFNILNLIKAKTILIMSSIDEGEMRGVI